MAAITAMKMMKHDGGDNRNEDDETEETQVHTRDQGIRLQDIFVEQVVDGKGNQKYEDDRDAQAGSRLHIFRYRQERTHSQEVSENHIVHKDGLDE